VESIADAVFTAVDVETTGLFPGVNRIVEIGAVSFRGDAVLDTFESLIDPGVPMPADAGKVNGITDGMLAGKPGIADVLRDFIGFLGGSYPVAHNAVFDAAFLSVDIVRLGMEVPDVPFLDTRGLARAAFPGRAGYSLDTLRRVHGLSAVGAHRALADAEACRGLFLLCVARIIERGARDIEALRKLSGRPLSLVGDRPADTARIIAIDAAMRRRAELDISYVNGSGERSERRIVPKSFRIVGGAPAVEAFCRLRGDDRIFLVASILSIDEVT
jgi:DNA polymerase-3 subunit epsilon